MTSGPNLVTSIGHEEGRPLPIKAQPIVDALSRGWSLLFGEGVTIDGAPCPPWPLAFGERWPAAPVFSFLPTHGVDVGWWPTGVAAFGAAPDIARQVHDKGFAAAVAKAINDNAGGMADWCVPLAPAQCSATNVLDIVRRWPSWASKTWTLKPRLGTSGRGRVRGDGVDALQTRVLNGLARFAAADGCVVEPWVKRTADYSTHIFVGEEHALHLGTLSQWTTTPGVCVGLEGRWEEEGPMATDASEARLEALRVAADAVATKAASIGYRGLLGIDAFAFEDDSGAEHLRPIVEANARFSMGSIALGLARRASDAGKLAPGETFSVALTQQALDNADSIWLLSSSEGEALAALHGKDAKPGLTFSVRSSHRSREGSR